MINQELLDYRDPLFGIITIFLFIFIASFTTYTFGIYKERKARKEYRKLLKRFELGTLKEDDYIHLYSTYNLPFDSIILLANSFIHKGQYSKAISVYLTLLEHVKEPAKKEELLEHLGNSYFKSGLLQRSKDIYLKILKFSPRNKVALNHLLLIFQSLKDFDKASEVLDSLEELEEDVIKEKIYINVLKIINDPILSFEAKSIQLYNNFKINKKLERIVADFLIKFNKKLFWEHIEEFNLLKLIDLLWYFDFDDVDFDKVNHNTILQEIYSAKGYISSAKSSKQFELSILISTKNSSSKVDIDINFEYICSKCKKVHPIYESRCPHCQEILTFISEPKIGKARLAMTSFL
ncbi:MAG: tetratricopeptide repeat protein [Campylobacterota bacterium]|nr:tetratricopeptide repeat protein [Campylobacterota bacterium]